MYFKNKNNLYFKFPVLGNWIDGLVCFVILSKSEKKSKSNTETDMFQNL